MDSLIKKAKDLLETRTVNMVIGFEKGTGGITRPALITSPAMADRLIYNTDCHHNLALFLTKKEVRKVGKVAIVAPAYIMKSIIVLAAENQIKSENLVVLGINTEGSLIEFNGFEEIENYLKDNPFEYRAEDKALLDKIDSMNDEERWDFWQKEFSKCIKCYACRASCPFCYCEHCTVDCNKPQWISVPSHELGNTEWHLMRAMHIAGRCVNCGQCGDACPVGIPVNILSLKLSEQILKDFNYKAGAALKQEYVLSTFTPNDKESFIK